MAFLDSSGDTEMRVREEIGRTAALLQEARSVVRQLDRLIPRVTEADPAGRQSLENARAHVSTTVDLLADRERRLLHRLGSLPPSRGGLTDV